MTTPPQQWSPVRTERLLLRDFRATDFADVHIYGSDPEVARYVTWGPNTLEDTHGAVEQALAAQKSLLRFNFDLAIDHDGLVIGSIGLHLRDGLNRTVELGYCLRRDFWRRGLVSEAALALLGVAFETLQLHRVFATCDARNTGSFAVMEKIGMRREGLFRLDRQVKGEWRDTYLYAILAEEWNSKR